MNCTDGAGWVPLALGRSAHVVGVAVRAACEVKHCRAGPEGADCAWCQWRGCPLGQ
jgi:hypothetical protein